jgi:hypothetical protein
LGGAEAGRGELRWAKWVAVVVFEEEKRGKTGV